MSEDRKRIYVGPPLRRAMDRRPSWSESKLVNALLSRLEEMVKRHKPKLTHEECIILRKALDLMPEPPTTFEEIMLMPRRVEIMLGQNAAGCAFLPRHKAFSFEQLVAAIDAAENV